MAERSKETDGGNLPLVNQYFAQTSDSRSNFFDDIASNIDGSAFMNSVVASGSSNDLFLDVSNSNLNIDVGILTGDEETNKLNKDNESLAKEEPVVCRIFSSQENISKQTEGDPARDFFDMIGSPSADGMSSLKSSPNLQIDFGLSLKSSANDILQADFRTENVYEDTFTSSKSSSGERERRRDAWIPSEKTRRVLIAAATAVPGTYFPERDLLTMPGVILEEDMVDTVQQVVMHFLGEAEASQRKVLTMNDVTQDERGLRELIQAECFRAAVNLTGRLLTIYGQGAGRAGHTSKHTVHSIQLWFTRIALLVKLQAFSLAEAEASVWWDCDRPDLYYQFYPELYGGRLGTLIPFQFRLLLAVLPSFCDRHQEALDRLHSVLAVIRKMLQNLDAAKSEDGSHIELSPQDREESKKLWQQREARVLHSVVNVALLLKDYWLAVDVLQLLCEKETLLSQKRLLHSVLGRVFLQLGDVVGAERSFQMAQSLKKSQTGTLTGHTADLLELVDRGLMALAQHAFQDAFDAFQKASLLEPGNITIQNNMSVCQLYLGNLKRALSILCETVQSHPTTALQENVLLNICTLFELESSHSNDNKLALLKLVNKHKGDAICISCLKLQM